MKTFLLFCSLIIVHLNLQAQTRTWVFLTDKGNEVATQLSDPTSFLSTEAIALKQAKGITLSEIDLPVNQDYITKFKQLGLLVLSQSRWLNAVVIDLAADQIDELVSLDFVNRIQPVQSLGYTRTNDPKMPVEIHRDNRISSSENTLDYGEARVQNDMINISALHDKGFTGKGVRVAVFDAGFDGADTINAFDSVWADKRMIAYYDFVEKNDSTLFRADDHGTEVLSTIVANIPGEMIGTAPHASILLARTENARSETQQEEHNWVRAVEWADSIGVDVIHTSLGYHDFDNDDEDYTYEDMDGNTAIITRAADMAASRGILVTTSAGNEGLGKWQHITAPCDGDSILCIGSVSKNRKYSRFSSRGPAADGRVKPDVVAMGSQSVVASSRNYLTNSNGTSFAAPIISGMVACLYQAHPKRSNVDIFQAIRLSSSQYLTPDEKYGYGIPDAGFTDSLLTHVEDLSKVVIKEKEAVPEFTENPQSEMKVNGDQLVVQTGDANIKEIYLMYGKSRLTFDANDVKKSGKKATFNTEYLLKGDYIIHIKTDKYEEKVKVTF